MLWLLWKTIWLFLFFTKLNILTCSSAVALLGIYSKELENLGPPNICTQMIIANSSELGRN
jgi:hypothetical protein